MSRSVVLTICVLLASMVPAVHAQQLERLFYYQDNEQSWQSFAAHVERVDVVAPTGYSVNEQGVVWGDIDPRLIRLAAEHDVAVMPLIVNPGFDQELLSALLADETARRRAIGTLVELCWRHGYAGIQFDFENIAIQDRDAYTRFFEEAAAALHDAGYSISMAVVHRPDALPGPTRYHGWLFQNWRAGYDLEAIGRIADFISIMSYSQHTRRTPPGPQAGLPWMEQVVEYFLRSVPAEKLSLGIATGSQHWYTSQEDRILPELARSYSEAVSHARARALLERYDARVEWLEDQQVTYGVYARGGTFEWIFLEDARSFSARLELARRHGLRGFSVWVLGNEDPAIWDGLAW
ncbi:MAG: glycosyl hydrolase family 18 protein [Longimicrobiales bacterium]